MHGSNWSLVKFCDACEIIMGQSPPGHTYNKEDKGLPFYQGKVDFGKVYVESPSTWCTEPIKIAEPGDILISVRAPVGPTNLCSAKCCIGRGLAAIRPKRELDYWFVFHYLRFIEDEITALGQGSTFSAISKSQICNLKIPLAPLPEQKRIAAKLKELMEEVERARTACGKQLEAAKALPAAYLREVFESEEAKKWERKRLAEVCEEFVNGGTPSTSIPEYWDGNIPWITGADVNNFWVSGGRKFITEEGLKNSATHLVKKNTVLIVTRTGVGKVGIVANDLCFSQDITGVICGTEILPEYLVRFLLSQGDSLIRIQRGATIKGLTRTDIECLEIPIPTLSVQQRITTELKEKMVQSENLLSAIRNQRSVLDALPQAILRKAFRGEL